MTSQNTLYGAPAASLAHACADLGDGLSAQLAALARDPSPEKCERLSTALQGARNHVDRLRVQLLADAQS